MRILAVLHAVTAWQESVSPQPHGRQEHCAHVAVGQFVLR